MKGWFLSVREDCKTCPFVLVCKSGFCPMDKHITKLSSSVICKNMQEKIRKNLALYAIFGCYEDILDVDQRGVSKNVYQEKQKGCKKAEVVSNNCNIC